MKRLFSKLLCGLISGVMISGSGVLQGAVTAEAKPTRIPQDMGYQWHLEPTVEADNIFVSDYDDRFEGYLLFHNYVYIQKDGKYGFIDHEGNMIIEPVYDSCNALRYGMDKYRAVYDSESGKTLTVATGDDELDHVNYQCSWKNGVPDIDGVMRRGYLWSTTDNKAYTVYENWESDSSNDTYLSYIVQSSTYSLSSYNSRLVETNAPIKDYSGVGDSELVSSDFGLANAEELLIPVEYPYAYASSMTVGNTYANMYCAFSKDKEKWTVFDHMGNEVMADLEPFDDNYFYELSWEPVSVMLYGEDEESFNKDFYVPAPFLPTEGVIAAKRDGECGYIDLSGNVLVDFGEFEDIRPVHKGLAWVKMNGKWGVIEILKNEGGNDQPETREEEEPCSIDYPGGTVDGVLCTEEMFQQDSTVYHKDISTLAVALSMAAYDGYEKKEEVWTSPVTKSVTVTARMKNDKNGITISSGDNKGYFIMDAYDLLGFDNKMLFSYSECPDEYKTGLAFKVLYIQYTGIGNVNRDVASMLYSANNGYENERAKKIYKAYKNGNPELTKNYRMWLAEEAYFDDYDERSFSIATKEFDDSVLVAFSFRGTSGLGDIVTDGNFLPDSFDIKDSNGNTAASLSLHQGFGTFYQDAVLGWMLYLSKYGEYIKETGKQVKFLFTGHSLGAACANICGYAANRGAFGSFVTEDDIYTYTYATPNVVTYYSEDTLDYAHNIFNMLNRDDIVAFSPAGYVKFGNCRQFKIEDEGFDISNLVNDHDFGRYVEGVKRSRFSESGENWVEHYYECPVDVEIYYRGKLIGRVEDEAADEEINLIPMCVDSNGAKSFSLPENDDFEVRVSAYDSGSMNVRFNEVTMSGESTGAEYEYSNISLEKGKAFSVPVTEKLSEQAVYVIDDSGSRIASIDKNGNESSDSKGKDNVMIVLAGILSFLIVLIIVSLIVLICSRKKKR